MEAVAFKSLPAQPASEIPDVLKGMFAFVQGENARLAKAAAAESGRHTDPPTKAVDLVDPSPATVREVTGAAEAPRNEPLPTPTLIARSSTDALAKVHPGFLTSSSVVLHRFGTDPGYARWRHELIGMGRVVQTSRGNTDSLTREQINEMSQLQAESRLPVASRRMVRAGDVAVMTTERNTTALFGAGRIDAIAAGAIEAAAAERVAATQFPEIRGRVCRVADGRIGRFGWKGQLASLDDFVLNACAVELGLEVPDHAQSADPLAPEAKARGLDLTARECAALTAYVASLPAPVERAPAGPQEAARIAEGRSRFEAIGCATCHRPKLGDVAGIYSDLLVHDMGPSLADSGSYGVNSSESPGQVLPRVPVPLANAGRAGANASRPIVGALRQEWRTPPLWGLRDSGPYLHDGRAATLEQAIASHGGEAQKTAQRFFGLDPRGRAELLTFLKSLVAPTQLAGR